MAIAKQDSALILEGGKRKRRVAPSYRRLAAVADPSAGSVVDTEARTAIAAILARLRQHGLIAS